MQNVCILAVSNHQTIQKLTTMKIANTKENNAKVAALKTVKETDWVGNVIHDTLDKCLMAINLHCDINSGWYTPVAIRINGLTGIFMINQDGSINWEARVIKQDEKKFLIEYLSNGGYVQFESKYNEYMN